LSTNPQMTVTGTFTSYGPGEVTIAEERLARLIAYWHGQRIVVLRGGGNLTVAGLRGYNSGWAWETDRYVDAHWREYVPAAMAVLEVRS
jgi:hypothetical protein